MPFISRLFSFVSDYIYNIFNPAISILSRVEKSIISRKAKVYRHSTITHSRIGDYTYIGPGARIVYATIGKYCSIAGDVCLGMATHPLDYISSSPIFISPSNGTGHKWVDKSVDFEEYMPIVIGHDVWIGSRAMILGGISIGNGAVIAAGAVVTKDIPPYAIVGGVPARVIRYRFTPEVVDKLQNIEWWNLPEDIIKNKICNFQNKDFIPFLNSLNR